MPDNDLLSLLSNKEMEDLITSAKKRKRSCSCPFCFQDEKVDEIPLLFCTSDSVHKVSVSTSFNLKDEVPQSQLRNCLITLLYSITANVLYGISYYRLNTKLLLLLHLAIAPFFSEELGVVPAHEVGYSKAQVECLRQIVFRK